MNKGVDVIYQTQFIDSENGFVGYLRFLIRYENGAYRPLKSAFRHSAQVRITRRLHVQ